MRRAITVLACALTACGNDPGALYCDPGECPSDDAGGTPRAMPPEEPPWLPALPDESVRAECTACAKEMCVQPRSSCLEDDACTEKLRCAGECEHPGCLEDCVADHGYSPWYDDLWSCVLLERCSVECQTGENLACTGEFASPVSDRARFPVTFRFDQGNPPRMIFAASQRMELYLAGATVRTCTDPSSPCMDTARIDVGTVDSSDAVTLEWWVSTPTFLELEDDRIAPYGLHERLILAGPSRSTELRMTWLPPDLVRAVAGGSLDLRTSAPLVVYALDCLTSLGRDLRVELPDLPDLEVLNLAVDLTPAETSNGLALVSDVPEAHRRDSITVQVVRAGSGEVVAEGDAFVRTGWVTHLFLVPSSR